MIGVRKAFALLALFAAGCSTVDIQAKDSDTALPAVPMPLSTEEALTVISTSALAGEDILQCVEGALLKEIPDLNIVSHKLFRDALFPWFEPGTAPTSAEQLAEVLSKSVVSRQIDAMKVRYVVAVGGGTRTTSDNWGGIVGGPQAAVVVGGVSIKRKTELVAQVLDLKSARPIAETKVSAEGEGGYGIIFLIPYISIPQTESKTCKTLAEKLNGVFK
jgi:hypothetical protein